WPPRRSSDGCSAPRSELRGPRRVAARGGWLRPDRPMGALPRLAFTSRRPARPADRAAPPWRAAGASFSLALDVTLMEHQGYEFQIEVGTTEAIAGGRYCYVATIVDLRRHHPDGRIELFATPLG